MADISAKLATRIRLGEDSTLELKSVHFDGGRLRLSRKGLADEMAALANRRGGTLVLGVDDATRRVDGIPLERLDSVERWVREICNDSISPALEADIIKVELENAEGALVPVLCVEVPRSLFVHKSPGGYFRRLGSSKREMSPEVLAREFQERSQSRTVRFDESIVPGTRRGDLDYALTQRFLRGDAAAVSDGPDTPADEVLDKLRIVRTTHDGTTGLTLAGTLLCTKQPELWLPHAYVQAVSYAGARSMTSWTMPSSAW